MSAESILGDSAAREGQGEAPEEGGAPEAAPGNGQAKDGAGMTSTGGHSAPDSVHRVENGEEDEG